jgi:hypothetical protein
MGQSAVFSAVASAVALLLGAALVTAVVVAQAGAQVAPARPDSGPLPPMRFEQHLARPVAVVQAAYEFAARHPDVLQYMPCYCGCEAFGHTGNHDCFIRRRAADGRVLEWDPHGSGCAVCVDVAQDAMLMFNAGASAGAIRQAIDAKYGGRYPSQTATPTPP